MKMGGISGYFVYISIILHFGIAISRAEKSQFSRATHITVDQSGDGDYQKIQDAIDAVPSHNSRIVHISVKPGTYREKIIVPKDKSFITLSGTSHSARTIITWNDSGNIMQSPTFTVLASDFVGRALTIQNTHGRGIQAVALRVSGDRAAFFKCRIKGHQDTLLDDKGRHYYSNCYIEGDTDFICGNAASIFKKCHLHSVSKKGGAITAQHRKSPNEKTGFIFLGCKITGVKSAVLGRPWGPYSRVVFAQTYMSGVILPQGWNDWGSPSKRSTSYYGEYNCYGPGANTSKRVGWSRSLSDKEAAPYLSVRIIGGKSWIRNKSMMMKLRTRFKKSSSSSNPSRNDQIIPKLKYIWHMRKKGTNKRMRGKVVRTL